MVNIYYYIMDKVIELLISSDLFLNKFFRIFIYFFSVVYSLFAISLVIDVLFAIHIFTDIDKVSDIFINIGVVIYLLAFVSLTKTGDENIKEANNNEERLLLFLNKKWNDWIYTIKEIQDKYFKEEYWKNIDSTVFSNLKVPKWNKYWDMTIRKWKDAFIEYERGWKVKLTKEWLKYIKENKLS